MTQQVNDATTKSGKTQLTPRYSVMTRAGKDPPSLKDLTKKSSILTFNKSESCDNMNLTAPRAVQQTPSMFDKQIAVNKGRSQRNLFEKSPAFNTGMFVVPVAKIEIDAKENH